MVRVLVVKNSRPHPSDAVRRAAWLGLDEWLEVNHLVPGDFSYLHDILCTPSDSYKRRCLYGVPWQNAKILLRRLRNQADLFVTIAATGDLRTLQTMRNLFHTATGAICVDTARMEELARANSQWQIERWLRDPFHCHWMRGTTTVKWDLESKATGRVAPYVPPSPDPTPSPHAHSDSPSLALQVFTHHPFLREISAFIERPLPTLDRFRQRCRADSSQSYGKVVPLTHALPRIAIIEGHLEILRAMYQCSSTNTKHQYVFDNAMHFAACEGRMVILQWLLTIPGTQHRCRPDTMARAVRCGQAEAVEWLHLHCPESGVTMSKHAIHDAICDQLYDVLEVCVKYSLGEFTKEAIAIAAGEISDVRMLRLLTPSVALTAQDRVAFLTQSIEEWQFNVVEFFADMWPEAWASVPERAIDAAIRRNADEIVELCRTKCPATQVAAVDASGPELRALIEAKRPDPISQ